MHCFRLGILRRGPGLILFAPALRILRCQHLLRILPAVRVVSIGIQALATALVAEISLRLLGELLARRGVLALLRILDLVSNGSTVERLVNEARGIVIDLAALCLVRPRVLRRAVATGRRRCGMLRESATKARSGVIIYSLQSVGS